MKVGIYNQWLHTMGGAERYSCSAAALLAAAGHQVELITHRPVAKYTLAAKLDLDLSGVAIRNVPNLPFNQLAGYTDGYDLFVNASFMTCVPSRARHSALFVYFPFPLDLSPLGRFKRRLGRLIKRELLVPEYESGFFGPQGLGRGVYRWTAGRGEVVVAALRPGAPLPVRVVVGSFRPPGWEPVPLRVSVDGRELATIDIATTPGNYVTKDVIVPREFVRGASVRLALESPTFQPAVVPGGDPDDFREVGVAVARVQVRSIRHLLYELLFERLVPEAGRRLHGLPDERALRYVAGYDLICPISEFSQRWLEQYWGVRGEVLYPPVKVDSGGPPPDGQRAPIILHVGRFQHGTHNKKQDVLIKAFRRLVQRGLSGWELHLAGGSMDHQGEQHRRYRERIERMARGWPIQLHVDLPRAELRALFERASVYWHATGYGERDPILFEHFGITTVEAMAAGAVPVVIARGAQPEIVQHGVNGLTWSSLDELVQRTMGLAIDSVLAARLRQAAIARSRAFSEQAFKRRLFDLLEPLLDAGPLPID